MKLPLYLTAPVTATIFRSFDAAQNSVKQAEESQSNTSHLLTRKKITGGFNGGIVNEATLKSLNYRKDFLFPFSLLLLNTRPVGRQVLEMLCYDGWNIVHHLTSAYLYSRTPYSF